MRVGINKSRDYNFTGAIDLRELLSMFPDPGIAQRIFRCADRNDPAADAEHRAMAENAEFLQFRSAARARFLRRRSEREKLADVGQEQCSCWAMFALSRAHSYLV